MSFSHGMVLKRVEIMDNPIVVILIAAAVLLLSVAVLAVISVIPGRKRPEMEKYKSVRFAHRGLHGDGAAENSMTAFSRAKSAGYGIELDIRLSRDGELVVYHDPVLSRVAGGEGRVIDFTAEELGAMRLGDTDDCIPRFRDVLELIDGEVPILIEIKADVGESGVAEKFIEEIEDYKGGYIVESFNPLALRTVRRARPDILRGILSTEYMKEEKYKGKLLYRLLQDLRLNFLARPDFIAYEKNGYKQPSLRALRRHFDTPLFAWTVRSHEEEAEAIAHGFDSVIFEGYIPSEKG